MVAVDRMGKKTVLIVVIMGGIGTLYLVMSGNLDSAWRGVTGRCGCQQADEPEETSQIRNRGAGHAVRGQYYPVPTGQIYVSDSGIY